MLAYHNDPDIKAKYIARVQAHLAAAALVLDRALLREHQGRAAIPQLPDGEIVESGLQGGDL